MSTMRIAVAALTFSAAALVGLAVEEGWAPTAMIPVKGDVPTVGFGSTQRDDGTPVRMGDTTTPVQALQRTLAYTQRAEGQLKRCLTAPLHQREFDLMLDFGYQYGVPTLCRSSIVRHANAGDYRASCEAYTLYRFVGKYDCATPGNKVCSGVYRRSLGRRNACLEVQ